MESKELMGICHIFGFGDRLHIPSSPIEGVSNGPDAISNFRNRLFRLRNVAYKEKTTSLQLGQSSKKLLVILHIIREANELKFFLNSELVPETRPNVL